MKAENKNRMMMIGALIAIVVIIAVIAGIVLLNDEEGTDIPDENRPPIAVAGGDVTIKPGETYLLDGRNSSDPDGDELEYYWDVDGSVDSDGDGVKENDRDLTGPLVAHTFPMVDVTQTIIVTLTVTDGEQKDSDTQHFIISVEPGEEGAPDVMFTVTYGNPPGLIADPHYILTVNTVTRMELISNFTYEIRDELDDTVLAGDLLELLTAGANETVRYVDIATSPEGVDRVSEGDSILIRDVFPVEEGQTFHLLYQDDGEAGMALLSKEIIP